MNIRFTILVLALLLLMSGCERRGPDGEGEPPESGPESSALQAPEPDADSDENTVPIVSPAEYGYWLPHQMRWIDDNRLVVAFQVRESAEDRDDKVQLVAYDVRDKSEQLVAALDNGYVGHLASNGSELVVTTSETIYVYTLPDLELTLETDNIGYDWGANTVEGLSAERDDTGIVIRSYTDPDHLIRVAEQTGDYLVDSPVWSPDGAYLRYSKYWGYVGDPIDVLVADRQGNPVSEIVVPEYESSRYWSSDSRHILSIPSDELDGMVRVYDAVTGEELAAMRDPNMGDFRDVWDVHGTKVAGWREADGRYYAFVYDALTGESEDVAALDAYCALAFSPDGGTLALIERENLSSRRILLLDLG